MTGKAAKFFLFEVKLDWITKQKGRLSAKDAEGFLEVATPAVFGGEGKPWTPEHYFLASISSCFMATFLSFAGKADLPVMDFECSVIGQISLKEGRYLFTGIDLYPVIMLTNESFREKANQVLEKAHQHCIISNSISTAVLYHPQVQVENTNAPVQESAQ